MGWGCPSPLESTFCQPYSLDAGQVAIGFNVYCEGFHFSFGLIFAFYVLFLHSGVKIFILWLSHHCVLKHAIFSFGFYKGSQQRVSLSRSRDFGLGLLSDAEAVKTLRTLGDGHEPLGARGRYGMSSKCSCNEGLVPSWWCIGAQEVCLVGGGRSLHEFL